MRSESADVCVLVGRPAPDFDLACALDAATGGRVRLADFRARWLVLLFYPADFSLVCPTELTALSQRYDELVAAGAAVLAVSTDPVETHMRWLAAPASAGGVGPLRFPLGSDVGGVVSAAYGVLSADRCVALRGVFVIDPRGVVQYHVVHNLSVGRRSDEIVRVLKALQAGGLCGESWQPGVPAIQPAEALQPGHRVSHFVIDQRIGGGAFATVYRAFDVELGRYVALKVFRSRDGEYPNVHAEARAAAALTHPNVCIVYGVDDREGVPMIVMEHLVGEPLTRVIESGPAPPERVSDIARQIAAGMAAAHEHGVTHGDLKPANIVLTREGVVKLLDFGLALRRPRPAANPGDSTLYVNARAADTIAGTPSYMSPEQAAGQPPGPASDVFALGLIIYELLRGQKAFGDRNVLEVLSQIRDLDPSRLTADLPEPYRALLPRMLARDPAARTITMRQIYDLLAADPQVIAV